MKNIIKKDFFTNEELENLDKYYREDHINELLSFDNQDII